MWLCSCRSGACSEDGSDTMRTRLLSFFADSKEGIVSLEAFFKAGFVTPPTWLLEFELHEALLLSGPARGGSNLLPFGAVPVHSTSKYFAKALNSCALSSAL